MANKPNLLTEFPEIAKEWDYEKNNTLTPQEVSQKSHKKVWWKCEKGHSYMQSPNNRTHQNCGCPYCSNKKVLSGYNDLATTCPEIAKEWNYDKNGSLTPQDVTKGSETKVWWKCEKGHSYIQRLPDKIRRGKCPICSGRKVLPGYNDLATTHPEIAKEWDYSKNGSLTPQDIAKGSETRIWWKCEQGHSYEARVANRTHGNGCPICSGKKVLPGYNDLATTHPDITKEWDYEKKRIFETSRRFKRK